MTESELKLYRKICNELLSETEIHRNTIEIIARSIVSKSKRLLK